MTLAGLPLAQVLAVFGVAALLTAALYVLKLRRRTVAVPFVKLWERVLRDKDATTLFSRLRRLLSLFVQLALLLLLALALGDPRRGALLSGGRHIVVLLDTSASMQATDVGGGRLADAKREVRSIIRGLGGDDLLLLARMDGATTALGPMTGDASSLERALDTVHATDTRADFAGALRFASDTLRGQERSEIIVVSDGRLGEAVDGSGQVHLDAGTKLTYVPIGTSADNAAITQFSVRRYPLDASRYEVMLEVTNTGREDRTVELSLLGDGALVDLTKLRLRAGERLPRFYPNLSGASRTLEAVIRPLDGRRDVLAVDDHAYALLPERRRAKVVVVTEGNTYLEAALLLDELLDVSFVTPAAYAASPPSATKADVLIFDGATPAASPRLPAIYIDPRGPGSPVRSEIALDRPGFDKIDRKHPIVRFVALDDVNIARGHKLEPGPGDRVVGASVDGPLLVLGEREGAKFVALGFDVRESDLPLRVAWPVFLMNCIHEFTNEDARYISSFRTGEVWRIPVDANVDQAILGTPKGEAVTVSVRDGRAIYRGEQAGFYDVRSGAVERDGAGASPSPTTSFAANLLDVEESSVEPVRELVIDGRKAGALEGFHVGVRRELWIYLLLAALLITFVEWFTFHRRITV